MKIGFVALQLGEMTGVSKAMHGQARAAREANVPIDFWVVSAGQPGEIEGIRHARFSTPILGARAAPYVKSRLLASVPELDAYDVLLLRYPTAIDFDPLALFRKRKAKIATIHHTKEVHEVLTGGRTAGLLARAAIEYVNGRRYLRSVDGIIGVTDEIRQYEVDRAGNGRRSATVANGVDVRSVAQTGFVPFDGRELKLLFIASSMAPWHGTDRLLASLRRYSGPVKLVLDLVGAGSGAPGGTVQTEGTLTIRHHGPLHGDALDAAFRNTTLAISSLAMFRNGLRQACVLKTREYAARGVPFVFGYEDVDLKEELPFCRQESNSDALLEIEPWIEFAAKVSAQRGTSNELRAFAEQHLDWKAKMRLFHAFASELR